MLVVILLMIVVVRCKVLCSWMFCDVIGRSIVGVCRMLWVVVLMLLFWLIIGVLFVFWMMLLILFCECLISSRKKWLLVSSIGSNGNVSCCFMIFWLCVVLSRSVVRNSVVNGVIMMNWLIMWWFVVCVGIDGRIIYGYYCFV